MDTVFIEGLEVDTLIGAYDWERGIRQCLHLDLTLGWDIRPAAVNDELDKALDYAQVTVAIDEFAQASRFELVETFAERLASALMSQFGIPWLRLRVTKPGVNTRARALGVEIERGCR
ncbi:dihydroneopterin aldolase [Stutzerimonas stutzeri]|uniref:dihydroneopterin aldolase n=1 Tax=Stutzerimonas stutzeri TaxID=316 RepID=UPI00210E36A3|nr:dihydroneopterin aldolase [Stutzerimonas stutzeri]